MDKNFINGLFLWQIIQLLFKKDVMKRYKACIILIVIFIIGNNANAAFVYDTVPKISNNQPAYTQLMKKYHNQKTISTVMIVTGGAMALVGFSLAVSGLSHLFEPGYTPPDYGSAPDILGIGGLIILAAAIPIKFIAKKNKRKAQMFIDNESMLITPQIKKASRLTSVGIKITL
jgi:hypothetical protein